MFDPEPTGAIPGVQAKTIRDEYPFEPFEEASRESAPIKITNMGSPAGARPVATSVPPTPLPTEGPGFEVTKVEVPPEWQKPTSPKPHVLSVPDAARQTRNNLFEKYANEGSFEQGRHGEIRNRVGAELIRMSNNPQNLPEYNEALRRLGQQELQRARGVNHR